MNVTTDMSADEGTVIDWLKMIIAPGLMFLLVTIFIVVFVCSEYSAGFLKNTVSQVSNRSYIYIGKLITSLVFIALAYIAAIVAIVVGSLIAIQTVHIGEVREIGRAHV